MKITTVKQATLFILLLMLAGCSHPDTPTPIYKVDVLASVYPLADVARQVGGPVVDATWMVESGQSLRGYQPDSGTREKLIGSRIVLLNSNVTEPWMTADSGLSLGPDRLLRLDAMSQAHSEESSGYLWLDPLIVKQAAAELSGRLLALRDKQQRIISNRTSAFTDSIDTLLQQYQPRFAGQSQRQVLAFSHDFDAMLYRIGYQPIVVTEATLSDLSDSQLDRLKQVSTQDHVTTLLVSADLPDWVRKRIEQQAAVQTVGIDLLGSSAPAGRHTYLELMTFNYDALLNGTAQ